MVLYYPLQFINTFATKAILKKRENLFAKGNNILILASYRLLNNQFSTFNTKREIAIADDSKSYGNTEDTATQFSKMCMYKKYILFDILRFFPVPNKISFNKSQNLYLGTFWCRINIFSGHSARDFYTCDVYIINWSLHSFWNDRQLMVPTNFRKRPLNGLTESSKLCWQSAAINKRVFDWYSSIDEEAR